MTYGVQPTGYIRKPLSVILAELESEMVTEFGTGVIQTPQSPLGQLNGLMADLIAEVDERNLDIYQSFDPDQAEGTRLDILARLRLIYRSEMTDDVLRRVITNRGQARVDIQDIAGAVAGVSGVTYSHVFVNESGETTNPELERGFVAVAVIGGDDSEIADILRQYIVPGVNTYGNHVITTSVEGFCRSLSIIRPVEIDVPVTVTVRLVKDKFDCPPPSLAAIEDTLETEWAAERLNGGDVSYYSIRAIVERSFSNVEVVSIQGARDGEALGLNETVVIGFIEAAVLDATLVLE